MPIYDYYCEKCEREFEVEQRITEDPIKTCRLCRSRRVKRLISKTAFVLKGGGWYSDLYSSSSAKSDGGDSSDAPASSGGDAKSSSDAKSGSDSKASGESKSSGGSDKGSSKSKSKSSTGGGKAAA